MEIDLCWSLRWFAIFESVFLSELGDEPFLRDGCRGEVLVPVDGHLENVVEDAEFLDLKFGAECLDKGAVPIVAAGCDDVVVDVSRDDDDEIFGEDDEQAGVDRAFAES